MDTCVAGQRQICVGELQPSSSCEWAQIRLLIPVTLDLRGLASAPGPKTPKTHAGNDLIGCETPPNAKSDPGLGHGTQETAIYTKCPHCLEVELAVVGANTLIHTLCRCKFSLTLLLSSGHFGPMLV